MSKRLWSCIAVVVFLLFGVMSVSAQVCQTSLEVKLNSKAPFSEDAFGLSVAAAGDTLFVGSIGEDGTVPNSGAAFVYTRAGTTWTLQQFLTASDAASFDFFGYSVGVSGDVAVIGAEHNNDRGAEAGAAYIFTRSSGVWTEIQKIFGSDIAAGDSFGESVDICGDTIVVGARLATGAAFNSGAAYVFRNNGSGWTQEAKLTASDGARDDFFGSRVAMDGNAILVGALGHSHVLPSDGAAYVFNRNAQGLWTETAELLAGDPGDTDVFGISVDIQEDTLLVGAYGDDAVATDAGAAYVFRRISGVWTQTQKITVADGQASDRFGSDVAVRGTLAVVGAFFDDDGGPGAGSAYYFERQSESWVLIDKFVPSNAQDDSLFGSATDISGDTFVVGAPFFGPFSQQGAAFVYDGGRADVTAPRSQTVSLGSNAIFMVQLTEQVPAVGFRWFKDGVALSDNGHITGSGTNTLTVNNVVSSDAGPYYVRVSDLCGKDISETAMLVVQ